MEKLALGTKAIEINKKFPKFNQTFLRKKTYKMGTVPKTQYYKISKIFNTTKRIFSIVGIQKKNKKNITLLYEKF